MHAEPGSRRRKAKGPWWRRLSTHASSLLLVFGVASGGILLASTQRSAERSAANAARLALLSSTKSDIVEAHLWLEEWVAGDKTVHPPADVDKALQSSLKAMAAVLDGRSDKEPTLEPLADPAARRELQELRGELIELIDLAGKRAREREGAGQIGAADDQKFDAMYRSALARAERVAGVVSDTLNRDRKSDLLRDRVLVGALLALFLVLSWLVVEKRKLLEQQNADLEARVAERTHDLRRSIKLAEAASEAKGQFLATMSHEIRTPLNAVIGMTGLLLDTNLLPEQQEFVETIRTSSESLLAIVSDILDYSRIESGKLLLEERELDVTECVEEALELVAGQASTKGLELGCLISADTPQQIVGDVTRLRQILVNLLSNAVKFTEKGEVTVSVSAKKIADNRVELSFDVADTGIGIAKEALEKLFQSFSQVDASTTRKYGGTGLGLAISKQLCSLMGGSISVESEVGVGTTFKFSIVAPLPNLGMDVPPVGRPPPSPLAGKRVLVVDDNATNRRILSLQLEPFGVEVILAESGRKALEVLSKSAHVDAVLLDIQMPEMDGLQVAAEIRKRYATQALPLIALSSSAHYDETAQQTELNLSGVLMKPVRRARLVEALSAAVRVRAPGVPMRRSAFAFNQNLGVERPLRILVAEDNAINQKVLLAMLGRFGYRADVAANGVEAIESLSRQPYDVVFMDVYMPEMDGLEATRKLRSLPWGTGVRVIAMTANVAPADKQECLDAGMDDFVGKPVRPEELFLALSKVEVKPWQAPQTRTSRLKAVKPTLDMKLVGSLRELGIWPELCAEFLRELPDRIRKLASVIEQKNIDEIRLLAHSGKGTAAAIGAARMASMFARIEDVAEGSSPTAPTEMLALLSLIEQEGVGLARAADSITKGEA